MQNFLARVNDVLIAATVEFSGQGPLEKLSSIALVVGVVAGSFAWLGALGPRARVKDWRTKFEAEERLRKDAEREMGRASLNALDLHRRDPIAALEKHQKEQRDGNEEAAYRALRHVFEESRLGWAGVCREIAEFEAGQLTDVARLEVAQRFSRLAALLQPEDEGTVQLSVAVGDLIAAQGGPGVRSDLVDQNWEASLDKALPHGTDGVTLAAHLMTESRKLYRNTQLRPALIAARRAVALLRRNLGEWDRSTIVAKTFACEVLWGWGRNAEALAALDELRTRLLELFGPTDHATTRVMSLRANCLDRLGRTPEAIDELDRVISVCTGELGEADDDVISLCTTKVQMLRHSGNNGAANDEVRRLITICRDKADIDPNTLTNVFSEHAHSLRHDKKFVDAVQVYDEACAVIDRHPEKFAHPDGRWQGFQLQAANCLSMAGNHEEALARLDALTAALRPLYRYIYVTVRSDVLRKLGHTDEANALEAERDQLLRGQSILESQIGRTPTYYDIAEAGVSTSITAS